MVTSGNSSRSRPRTSPIDRYGRSFTPEVTSAAELEEDEPELADLQFVAVAERGLVDALLVDVGPVQRTRVTQHVPGRGALDLGMAAGHGDVVEHDLAVGMPPEA